MPIFAQRNFNTPQPTPKGHQSKRDAVLLWRCWSGASADRNRRFDDRSAPGGVVHQAGILLFCFTPVCFRHRAMHLARFGVGRSVGKRFMHFSTLTAFG